MSDFHQIMNAVKEFHQTFGLDFQESPKTDIGDRTIELRHRLMAEENDEYLEAAKNNDLVQVADALGDKLYILCGTIIAHGMQHKIVEVFEEIHRSNMSKLDENGKPIYREDGKIMKSNRYFVPDIESVLIK
ncbi:MAG TPA: nucleoside triphosphate pyrophosphohydrolase family protein [Bacteroidia bacterium]|nr:nucleoside triphosphate pyrophosphohydrolase family protein [Bacteroidia bacterium]HQF29708.1 nucleoside triphosphate pyrophosphohydrolase family protein [Bacteroidia bacterium]